MIWVQNKLLKLSENHRQVKTDLCTAGKKHDSHSSDIILSWLWRKKEAREKTPACGWKRWKWQSGFLSMFEEQRLTFTTKSSNMLSATPRLWAWQSPGFSVIMEIFVYVSAWRKPRGAFTGSTIRTFPPSNSHLWVGFLLVRFCGHFSACNLLPRRQCWAKQRYHHVDGSVLKTFLYHQTLWKPGSFADNNPRLLHIVWYSS